MISLRAAGSKYTRYSPVRIVLSGLDSTSNFSIPFCKIES